MDKVNSISLRTYVERIFEEKDRLAESQRETLERALVEARETTEKALIEAKTTVESRLVEAKGAADAVQLANIKRLENLELGGAPFASRLDLSLTQLKTDVDILKENMVRSTVLDALRKQQDDEARVQKRQIRNLNYTLSFTVLIAVGNIVFQLAHG